MQSNATAPTFTWAANGQITAEVFKGTTGFIFCSFRMLKFMVLINCNAFDWELLLKINSFLLYTDEMQLTAISGEIFITQDIKQLAAVY